MDKRVKVIAPVVAALLVGLAVLWSFRPVEELAVRSSANYGWLREEQFKVTAAGTEGSAVGNKASDGYVRGHIYGIHLDFTTGISSTTDFTLTTRTDPSISILSLSNNYTDTWYYPVVQQTDSAGSGTSTYDRLTVNDRVIAGIVQSSVGDVVTVTLYWGQ